MTLIDAAPATMTDDAERRFSVELLDGQALANSNWPSISAGPEFLMHVFQSREFLDVWMATVGRAQNAQCVLAVAADSDKKPVLYLPLFIQTRFNMRILRFMDAGIADLNAPILVAGQDLTRGEFMDIWAAILSLLPRIDIIDLQKMPSHVCGVRNPFTYLECRHFGSSGHAVDLAKWQEVIERGSTARMHSKLRRHYRILSKTEPTAVVTNPSGKTWQHTLDGLTALKRAQYRRTGRDFFAAPGVQEFYREIAAPERLGRISHLSAITCGNNIVAAHLGFIGRGRFYYILPAFDTDYRSYAVGLILLKELIEHCAEEKYTVFDLGEGDYSYKDTWETHRLPLLSHEQSLSAAGMVYRRLRRARRFFDGGHLHERLGKGWARRSNEVH